VWEETGAKVIDAWWVRCSLFYVKGRSPSLGRSGSTPRFGRRRKRWP